MQALIFDKTKSDWDSTKGFELADVPKPEIEKDTDVIIRVHYAGVCGSDKGIWYRQAFKEQILGSIDAENFPPLERGGIKGEVEKLQNERYDQRVNRDGFGKRHTKKHGDKDLVRRFRVAADGLHRL